MQFGEWLKEQRKAMGMNQRQLAEAVTQQGARVATNTACAWEHGRQAPTLKQFIALCRVIRSASINQSSLSHMLRDTADALILPPPPARGTK